MNPLIPLLIIVGGLWYLSRNKAGFAPESSARLTVSRGAIARAVEASPQALDGQLVTVDAERIGPGWEVSAVTAEPSAARSEVFVRIRVGGQLSDEVALGRLPARGLTTLLRVPDVLRDVDIRD